ncbi:VOC family protein [Litorivivens sp.]|uniref:VOC family protein n=1 Tax=Litorivivens sp. TaxID=2020868 RepID=UPI0035687771
MADGIIIGVQHLAINVTDIAAARQFYGDILGLTELPRPSAVAEQFRSIWYLLGNAELHVVENPEFTPLKSPLGPHFAVACDDFTAACQRISALTDAIVFGPARAVDGIERMVVRDPTGNVIEIIDLPLHNG